MVAVVGNFRTWSAMSTHADDDPAAAEYDAAEALAEGGATFVANSERNGNTTLVQLALRQQRRSAIRRRYSSSSSSGSSSPGGHSHHQRGDGSASPKAAATVASGDAQSDTIPDFRARLGPATRPRRFDTGVRYSALTPLNAPRCNNSFTADWTPDMENRVRSAYFDYLLDGFYKKYQRMVHGTYGHEALGHVRFDVSPPVFPCAQMSRIGGGGDSRFTGTDDGSKLLCNLGSRGWGGEGAAVGAPHSAAKRTSSLRKPATAAVLRSDEDAGAGSAAAAAAGLESDASLATRSATGDEPPHGGSGEGKGQHPPANDAAGDRVEEEEEGVAAALDNELGGLQPLHEVGGEGRGRRGV